MIIKTIPSSTGLIILLLLVIRADVSWKLKGSQNCCTAVIYKRRLKFCPKENMNDAMGNVISTCTCGSNKTNEESVPVDCVVEAKQSKAVKSTEDSASESGAKQSKDDKSTEDFASKTKQSKAVKSTEDSASESGAKQSKEDKSTEDFASKTKQSKEVKSTEDFASKTKQSKEIKSTEDSASERKVRSAVIEKFGYKFVSEYDGDNKFTVLRDIRTGSRFEFDVYGGDRAKNQWRYEELGEAVTEYVYEYLEKELKLKKFTIPVDAGPNDPQGFIFMSENALESDKLMILIHGSGVVQAGQWARSLIINASFESGTMVPYIERATKEGFGVLITNGNQNYDARKYKKIKGIETPQDHFVYVWNKFIKKDKGKAKDTEAKAKDKDKDTEAKAKAKAKAQNIVIVAHSFGGVVVLHGLRNMSKKDKERIKAVAFTDSVHSVSYSESSEIKRFFKERTRNWISSYEPLDKRVRGYYGDDCQLVSAGTTEHVWTSHCAKDSVFNFFKEKLGEDKYSNGCGSSVENSEVDNKAEKKDDVEVKQSKDDKNQHTEKDKTRPRTKDSLVPLQDQASHGSSRSTGQQESWV